MVGPQFFTFSPGSRKAEDETFAANGTRYAAFVPILDGVQGAEGRFGGVTGGHTEIRRRPRDVHVFVSRS